MFCSARFLELTVPEKNFGTNIIAWEGNRWESAVNIQSGNK